MVQVIYIIFWPEGLLTLYDSDKSLSTIKLIFSKSNYFKVWRHPPKVSSHQVAKVLEHSISPSSDYSGLSSFRIDWFDVLAVQGTLKHHSQKASILQRSDYFMVQLSHLYMTTGKTIPLPIQTFVNKVMSLLFNTLSLSQLFFQASNVKICLNYNTT